MKVRLGNLVILPLLVYTLAAVFITYPLVTQLSTHIAGAAYTDSFEYARLGWWGKYALANGMNPFYQSLLGYPDGFFSAVQWAQPLIYLPISLLGAIVDPTAAFNLWLLLEIILSGVTAYWLCLDIAGENQIFPALLGGLIFMAFPTVQGHLTAGHVNPLSNYALPIVALCLYRILHGRSDHRTIIVGAAALLIMALGNFTFPVFALLPLLLFGGLYALLFRRDLLDWRRLRQGALMLLGGAVLSMPFYVPLAADILAPERPAYLQEGGWVEYSTDLLAFVSPSPFVGWLQPMTPDFARTVLGTNSIEGTAYLGIAAVVLSIIAVVKRREASLWLVIALGCMLFSLGPILKVRDEPVRYRLGSQQVGITESQIVMPYALLQNLPFISSTRTPGRFNMTTGLALGVLAAMGLSWLLQRVRKQWQAGVITFAVAILVLAEYQLFFPFPTTPTEVTSYFHTLAGRHIDGAVFDVPWNDPLAQKQALWQQTVHQQPLLAGHIARRTPIDPAKLVLLSDVLTMGSDMLAFAPGRELADIRYALASSGVRVVVFHRDLLEARWDQVMAWAQQLMGAAVYRDEHLAIYELTTQLPSAEDGILLTLNGNLDSSSQTTKGAIWWLRDEANLFLYSPAATDYHLHMRIVPALQSRHLQVLIAGQVRQAWQIEPPAEQIDVWLSLEAGFHTLRLVAPAGCTPIPVAPLCTVTGTSYEPALCAPTRKDHCVSVGIEDLSGESAAREMRFQPMEVTLSEGMHLLGFRIPSGVTAGQKLTVVTEWNSTQPLTGDYHLFVHVVDEAGTVVAQYDGVPGENTTPTTQWSTPQRWTQVSVIPIPSDLPRGNYRVYTGWYRYPDLTRLQVQGDRDGAKDGLVFIGSLANP